MKKPVRVAVAVFLFTSVAGVFLFGATQSTKAPKAKAPPPAATDMGPAVGLSTPGPEAVVFDLKYRPRTGSEQDLPYNGYWGYGGATEQTKTDPFLKEVRKKASTLHYVYNPAFKGRIWSAVEYKGKQALALYFDANANGKLDEGERVGPAKHQRGDQGIEFITPDFINTLQDGAKVLTRALLQVNFYEGNSEPNSMWSPAALLEGQAKLNGKPVTILLIPNSPGGSFEKFGSSSYSLQTADSLQEIFAAELANRYLSSETLSSLIWNDGQFYHMAIEGRRTNGLPARLLLTADKSPTGTLMAKLSGAKDAKANLNSIYLNGVSDKTVFFRCSNTKSKVTLPEGTYSLNSGQATYGGSGRDRWELWFSEGPEVKIAAGQDVEVTMGEPKLTVRAVEEQRRYDREAASSSTFKAGTKIYLEPKIVGKGKEAFTRFRQDSKDRPPKITITDAGGKELLSKTMEYG